MPHKKRKRGGGHPRRAPKVRRRTRARQIRRAKQGGEGILSELVKFLAPVIAKEGIKLGASVIGRRIGRKKGGGLILAGQGVGRVRPTRLALAPSDSVLMSSRRPIGRRSRLKIIE